MRLPLEKFFVVDKEQYSELVRRLDRNFDRLAVLQAPYAVSMAYTFLDTDSIYSLQVDATVGAITIKLPLSPTGMRRRTVIKTDVSANAVTVSGNGSLINGATTRVLAAQFNSATFEPTGTGWLIVAST